jgi:hypothetical protein
MLSLRWIEWPREGAAKWQSGFARLTGVVVSARVGDTLIWSAEQWVRPSYTNFQLP